VRDLTGLLQAWIEVGTPEAARLHKASKAAPRVAIYPHRDTQAWLARLAGERIHRAGEIELRVIDSGLIKALAARLEKRMDLDVSMSEGTLYVSQGEQTLTGGVVAGRLLTTSGAAFPA
jgi:uncharacterized protein YaeQ